MSGQKYVWLKQQQVERVAGDDEKIPAAHLTRSLAAIVGEAGVSEVIRQCSIK